MPVIGIYEYLELAAVLHKCGSARPLRVVSRGCAREGQAEVRAVVVTCFMDVQRRLTCAPLTGRIEDTE